jgi:hypothetical protein
MNLKSFGCSFVFGTDLQDSLMLPGNVKASQKTWPAWLAKHLNYSYECFANPGSGNLQILEQVLNQVPVSTDQDLFVIGWTWTDRFDYYDSSWDSSQKLTPWNTIMPIDEDNVAKTYYRDLHSEYRDKFTCLSYVKLAIDTLDQRGIPFVMTFMDELIFDQRWHVSPAVQLLQDQVRPHMIDFEGYTFLDWSRHHGFAESATWHPLESAHRAAADYMITVVDKQKTNVPVQPVRV